MYTSFAETGVYGQEKGVEGNKDLPQMGPKQWVHCNKLIV
jgi:hypothetical protein